MKYVFFFYLWSTNDFVNGTEYITSYDRRYVGKELEGMRKEETVSSHSHDRATLSLLYCRNTI